LQFIVSQKSQELVKKLGKYLKGRDQYIGYNSMMNRVANTQQKEENP